MKIQLWVMLVLLVEGSLVYGCLRWLRRAGRNRVAPVDQSTTNNDGDPEPVVQFQRTLPWTEQGNESELEGRRNSQENNEQVQTSEKRPSGKNSLDGQHTVNRNLSPHNSRPNNADAELDGRHTNKGQTKPKERHEHNEDSDGGQANIERLKHDEQKANTGYIMPGSGQGLRFALTNGEKKKHNEGHHGSQQTQISTDKPNHLEERADELLEFSLDLRDTNDRDFLVQFVRDYNYFQDSKWNSFLLTVRILALKMFFPVVTNINRNVLQFVLEKLYQYLEQNKTSETISKILLEIPTNKSNINVTIEMLSEKKNKIINKVKSSRTKIRINDALETSSNDDMLNTNLMQISKKIKEKYHSLALKEEINAQDLLWKIRTAHTHIKHFHEKLVEVFSVPEDFVSDAQSYLESLDEIVDFRRQSFAEYVTKAYASIQSMEHSLRSKNIIT